MNAAFEIGAAALRAGQRALELHAGNVANVNTPAFKRSEARFAEVLARTAPSDPETPPPTSRDNAADGAGVRMVERSMLFSQGELRRTGNPLDLAIQGQGLIELIGPGGEALFWRGGGLSVNEDGLLATAKGIPLRAGIVVPGDAETLAIAPDGVVSATVSGGEAMEIGRIALVRFDRESAMEPLDDGLFRAADGARLTDARPGEDGAGMLAQGSIEESNVALTDEMVQMLVVQRAFAANAQIVQAADQFAAIVNNLKG